MNAPVTYWIKAAREQNRRVIELRRDARKALRVRVSGRLYDEARHCRYRRGVFMSEARKLRAALARVGGAA